MVSDLAPGGGVVLTTATSSLLFTPTTEPLRRLVESEPTWIAGAPTQCAFVTTRPLFASYSHPEHEYCTPASPKTGDVPLLRPTTSTVPGLSWRKISAAESGPFDPEPASATIAT